MSTASPRRRSRCWACGADLEQCRGRRYHRGCALNRNGLGSIEVIGVYQSKADARCNYNMTIWAKSWSEIIEECTGRLKFFQDRLNYNASQSSGRKYLRETYPKFIPHKPDEDKAQ